MLNNGSMKEGLQLLTGAPSDRISLEAPDDEDNANRDLLWTQLISACEYKLVYRGILFVFYHIRS